MTTLTITAGDIKIDFGVVSKFTDSFSKSVMTTPIISLTSDSTFALETGASMSYTAEFSRVSPEPPEDLSEDSTKWSNGKWADTLDKIVNRWQMRTDGARMVYEPSDPGESNTYIPKIEANVFISSLSVTFNEGYTDYLTGSITMDVGSSSANFTNIYSIHRSVRSVRGLRTAPIGTVIQNPVTNGASRESTKESEAYITLSNADRSKIYLLRYSQMGEDGTCVDLVDQYRITGGPESPFESVTMALSRKKLMTLYPDLAKAADGAKAGQGLLVGNSVLTINGVGSGTFVVTKCRMTSDKYTLTGYCLAESLKGYNIGPVQRVGTPMEIIKDILRSGDFGVRYDVDGGSLVTNCNDDPGSTMILKPETNVWVALQLCAHALNAKIFFANNKVYLIDYGGAGNSAPNYFGNGLELYPGSDDGMLYNNVVGSNDLGSEGSDTILNSATVLAGYEDHVDEDGNTVRERNRMLAEDIESEEVFGVHAAPELDLKQYIEINNETKLAADNIAEAYAKYLVAYRSEPQQSIRFTVKERRLGNGELEWTSFFPIVTTASSISSRADDISISNRSCVRSESRPQKLYLSKYTRKYPEGTSDYWFGIAANVDLAQSTSEIMTILGR